MIFVRQHADGVGVALSKPRRERIERTDEQIRAERHALWLFAFERGMWHPLPAPGGVRRWTRPEIARCWKRSIETVGRGLAEARELRALIQEMGERD